MTATAPCAVASAARSVRSAERSSSRSTSRWTHARAGDPVPGCAADVFLLHHKHYPFQTPNARPARSRRRGLRARERTRNRTLRAAPSHTATLLPPSGGATDLAASDARDRTRCVFSHASPSGSHLPSVAHRAKTPRHRATGRRVPGESTRHPACPALRRRCSTAMARVRRLSP
jgi:hypothetical protein